MKKLDFKIMESINGALNCADKEGYVLGAMGMGLLLAPVTGGGSIIMSLSALYVSQVQCHN